MTINIVVVYKHMMTAREWFFGKQMMTLPPLGLFILSAAKDLVFLLFSFLSARINLLIITPSVHPSHRAIHSPTH
jgi:hypothetical protein